MTITIHLVGDGPRDEHTVPGLVRSVLNHPVELVPEKNPGLMRHWTGLRLHGGGYVRKLKYAIEQARTAKVDGLVAVVDTDRERRGERLKALRRGRDEHRAKSVPFPCALGEADPHAEAWLLDDPHAVRQGLGLGNDVEVVTVRKTKSPKGAIDSLVPQGARRDEPRLSLLADIARGVSIDRCAHTKETGFHAFAEEVRDELGPVVRSIAAR